MSKDHHEEEFRLHTPEFETLNRKLERREFLTKTAMGLGAIAVGSLFSKSLFSKPNLPIGNTSGDTEQDILRAIPHFAPKAKRVVYLFMSGGPSQFELFDYKPKLATMA